MNNLATEANLTDDQMNDVINLARPAGQFMRESARRWTNRGRSVDGRGRSRSSGPKKPPRGYVVEKCRWFYNPDILYCPWGDQCWNSHDVQSAQASRSLQNDRHQETNWRNRSASSQEDSWGDSRSVQDANVPLITPAYNPSHPLFNDRPVIPVPASAAQAAASASASAPASGNENGQSQGAASVRTSRPPTPPRYHSYSSATSQEESVSLEEAARRRVQEALRQRRSDRSHVQAMQDPGWTDVMAAAEEVIRKNQPQNMEREDQDRA